MQEVIYQQRHLVESHCDFKCSKCKKSFTSKEYTEQKPARTELFRSLLVSFLYERGWRQNFNRSGFPGLDEEFQMAQDYFQLGAGGILLDVSCGSRLTVSNGS